MRIVDANVLLHAVNRDSPEHAQARSWLDAVLSGTEMVGFAWSVLLAFLRVSTHSVVVSQPLAPGAAVSVASPACS